METKEGVKAIKKIAKERGMSVNQVRKEIVEAIKEAYKNPITRWEWERMFGENVIPTPEEFIVVMAKKVKNKGVSGNKKPVY